MIRMLGLEKTGGGAVKKKRAWKNIKPGSFTQT
jgi:hypothetical protein